MSHIVIIGNGIAGVTTARYVRKGSDHRITLISDETRYFFSRTALMYIYMGHMEYRHTKPYEDWFWEKNRIELLRDRVERIDPKTKTLQLRDHDDLAYDKLVLTTGSRYNKFGWQGEDLEGVGGMVSYQDLAYLEELTPGIRSAVIVGGGLIGIELAEMLHTRNIPVTMLVREKSYWSGALPPEESAMVTREIYRHGIDLRLETELDEMIDNGDGRVQAISTVDGEEIGCQYVGLTAGVHPNIELASAANIETNKGFLVDEYLQTSVPDIFAAGDCAELRSTLPNRRAIEAVWYTGKRMGPALAATLCGDPTPYDAGFWFNSAKFFDIEWQTYGYVPTKPAEGIRHFWWEHPEGRKGLRIVYADDGRVLGFNSMGIRYRQRVCQHWIESGTHIDEVMQNLGAANFDPEFYREHEAEIVQKFNQETGKSLSLKRKRGLRNVFQVLR